MKCSRVLSSSGLLFLYAAFLIWLSIGISKTMADGLPGENIVTQRWRELTAQYSPICNPALLTEEDYLATRLSLATVYPSEALHTEAGVTLPIGLYQSAGLSMIVENSGDVSGSYWDQQGIWREDTSGTKYRSDKMFLSGTYALNPWNKLSVGMNLSLAYEGNFGSPQSSAAADLGLTYRLFTNGLLGTHLVGISTQNALFIPLANSGLPAYAKNLKFSWLADFWEHKLEAGIDIDFKDLLGKLDDKAYPGADTSAITWFKTLEKQFSFRVGGWILRLVKLYLLGGNNHVGAAAGFNIPTMNNGRDLAFLYQFLYADDAEASYTHTFYVKADLGRHREEVFASKLRNYIDVDANDLFVRARKLYMDKKYWDAFFLFGQILVKYPNFYKNDWVNYYMGSCLEQLDMREEALKVYKQTETQYQMSPVRDYARLGMMRIYYRQSADGEVSNMYQKLRDPSVLDSLRYHAYYLMAQTHLKNGNYDNALQLFEAIPQEHPEYVFSNHSAAVAHIRMNRNIASAIEKLSNCIDAAVRTPAQREVVNRSYVFLGYIFYHEQTLSKAVIALRAVPNNSYYYEDALLGLAWTALKAQQWNDCSKAAAELVKVSSKPVIKAEGLLLQAYAQILQKNYLEAVQILESASNLLKTSRPPTEDTLTKEKNIYVENRSKYNTIAQNANKYARELQSDYVLKQIDSLHTMQKGVKSQLDEFMRFSDEFIRHSFFIRNLGAVTSDIEFTLATAQKLAKGQKATQQLEKVKTEEDQIDKELEKVRQEIQKLKDEPAQQENPKSDLQKKK